MKISIVTISFNQAGYIGEAINSIVNQDFEDAEYIIVDAGSTDSSRELILGNGGRIAKTIFEPDKGPADGLNKGFRFATGEIFGYVNADDYLLPGALAAVAECFERNADMDVLCGNGYVVDSSGMILRKVYSDEFSLRRFAYGCVTFMQTAIFFRRQAFEEVGGFNVANKINWDSELLVDFALRKKTFGVINRFLACFRLHPDSITTSIRNGIRLQMVKEEEDRLFQKAMHRERRTYDVVLGAEARIEKWIRNPRNLLTRTAGKIFRVSHSIGVEPPSQHGD